MANNLKKWHLPFLLLLVIGTWLALNRSRNQAQNMPYQHDEGIIFGTIFHATYQSDKDLHEDIMAALQEVDRSLSMFNPQSTISKINEGTSDEADSLMISVMNLSQTVSRETGGAFDVTVAPLVNAWGFGFKNGIEPSEQMIDSLRQLIGWEKITLEGNQVKKADPRMILDFSAVAKGFGSDRVAEMFRQKGIRNFMIEIGGEVVTHGLNPKHSPWRIGVNKPEDDSTSTYNEVERILQLSDCAMATSGNYRNYYVRDGKKIAHTIDPHTGYPVQHSILSSTVLAPSCAMADAFATSFMVLGLDKSKEVLSRNPQLQAYFIYADNEGNNQVWYTASLEEYFVK